MGRRRKRGTRAWRAAQAVLSEVLTARGEEEPRFGYLKSIGSGLYFRAFHADAVVDGESVDVVVRVPGSDADEVTVDEIRAEIAVREKLGELDVPFEVAAPIGYAKSERGWGVVDRLVSGAALSEKVVSSLFDPVEITAVVAVACHDLDPDPFRMMLTGPATRREHAEAELSVFDEDDAAEFGEVRDWAREHLPAAEPSRLVHGDLLGQNILVQFDSLDGDDWDTAVIDWSAVRLGEPAYDLAVVRRGKRKVYGEPAESLVGRYNSHSRHPVSHELVRLFELAMLARWFVAERDESGESAHSEQLFMRFRALWRRTAG